MKNALLSFAIAIVLLFSVSAPAADKVVIIPLGGEQPKGDALPTDVLEGKTFSNENDTSISGTMTNRGAIAITPGTDAQPIPEGYHNGSGEVEGDANLSPENIKSGVSIFGVAGSLVNPYLEAGETCSADDQCISKYCANTSKCSYAFRRVFLSTTSTNGNMGGVAGADAICATDAAQDPRTAGRVFFAWISTQTYSPANNFQTKSPFPYVLVTGVKVADDWDDLVDGTLDNPINVTATGTLVLPSVPPGGVFPSIGVWTGTGSSGVVDNYTSTECNGWTTTSANGLIGNADADNFSWTDYAPGENCTNSNRLYCIEQW